MSDLIARLEKATGPDRQLDLAIHTAIFGQPSEDNLDELLAPEAYTDSVDAALTLMPEGWIWSVTSTGQCWMDNFGGPDNWMPANGNTPALAICIAAMKAREHGKT